MKEIDRLGVHNVSAQAKTFDALQSLRLEPSVLATGNVKAVVDGHAESVNAANLLSKVDQKAVFVQQTADRPTKFTLTSSLLAALPPAAAPNTVKLGYLLTAPLGSGQLPIHLVAVVAPTSGLLFNAVRSIYVGGISVALVNTDDQSDQRILPVPVTLSVFANGASEITPTPITVPDVGRWHAVSIAVPSPNDPYRVEVRATPQDKGDAIELAVSWPRAQLVPASTHVLGWGIGTVPITVVAQGLPGLRVTLQTDHGMLSQNVLTLDNQGSGSVSLRSDAASSTSVRVGNAGVVVEPVTITFDPPWLFLASAIAGGLLGAFIRGKARKRWGYALAIGIASAILMTVLYAVGVDWASKMLGTSRLATSGEAVVFALGAIAALLGANTLITKSN
jgi:hypothetical protein